MTDPRPSLAELRKANALEAQYHNRRNHVVASPDCKTCAFRRGVDALIDIAEAAQALDTALLHDAVAGDQARTTLDDLDEALAEVRP